MNQQKRTYFIQTYGCQMNESDSERFATYLDNLGFESTTDYKLADIVVLNTCSVRQKAEDRVNGAIDRIVQVRENQDQKIIITGCIARRVWDDSKNVSNSSQKSYEERVEELKKVFPKADEIVETKDFPSIGKMLGVEISFNDKPEHYLSAKPKYKNSFQAYVPISTGCNHFCTFCIVPFARGKEVCRPASEIIREVFDLVKNGYKDITLLGQTVNRWINPDFIGDFEYNEALTKIKGLNEASLTKADLKLWQDFFIAKLSNLDSAEDSFFGLTMPKDFLQLLQVLDQIPGEWWTTWVSSHPNYMTDELLKFIGESVKNSWVKSNKNGGHQRPFIHYALQSGSNKILRRMNRRYTIEEFKEVANKMYEYIPDLTMTTDIIVGFIGETEEDFLETIKAQEDCKFDLIYISEYSSRPGTAASRLKDTVDNFEKANRKERLNDVLANIAKIKNEKFIDSEQKILVDHFDKKHNILMGRTFNGKVVRILNTKDQNLIGKFISAKVVGVTSWSFNVEVIN